MMNNQGQQPMRPVTHTSASADPYAAAMEASFPSVTNNTISNNCINFNNNINSNNNLFGGMIPNFPSSFPPSIPTTLNNLRSNNNNNNNCNSNMSLLSQSLAAAQQMMTNGQSQQYQQPIISRSAALANSINSGLNNQSFSMPSSNNNTTITVASSSIGGGSTYYNNNLGPASVTPPNIVVTGPSSTAKKSSSASHLNHHVLSNSIIAGVCKGKTPTISNVRSSKPSKRHSAPPQTSIILKSTPRSTQTLCLTRSDVPTHPVPEFLCHLYSMVNEPSYSDLISWNVPTSDEGTTSGGGKAGVGKIVIHDPTRLQDEVLGKYYRHSKYSSFQRQLNYFGFKKRMHGTKKGKMSPCSFVHESLSTDPHSLLNLKRRPPSNKRTLSESDLGSATVVSATSTACLTAPAAICLIRPSSNNTIKKSPKSKGKSTKSKVKKEGGIQSKLSNVKCNKNASWNHALNTPQGIAQRMTGPLKMPLSRQVPGQVSWSASSSTSLLPKKLIPKKKTGLASIDLPDATKDTIIEAKKLLEQNFRKTIQQAEQSLPSQHQPPPQEQHSGPSYPQQQQQAQLPLPVSMLTSNVQQSQQLIKLLRNHASALQMNDNGKVLWQQFDIQQQQQPAFAPASSNPNWMNMGQVEKFSFPQANNTDTLSAFAPNFATKNNNSDPQAVDNNFFGNFPSKSPDLLNNFEMDVDAANAANTMSTNYLMTASSDPQNMLMQQAPTNTTFPITTNTTNNNESHPQGMMDTPPNQIQQQLDDLLNNLLSTALPPSDELFDDDMSAGDVSEFDDLVGEALQVSDDGGMLSLDP